MRIKIFSKSVRFFKNLVFLYSEIRKNLKKFKKMQHFIKNLDSYG